MIKQTIVCDRCGKEQRESSLEWLTLELSQSVNQVFDRHLCPDCKTDFDRFMKNLPVEEK